MTKKLRKGLLAFFLVAVLACLAGLSVLFTRHASADEVSGDSESLPLAATVYLGREGMPTEDDVYYRTSFAAGWQFVVSTAAEAPNKYVRVILWKDWVATNTTASGFGTDAADATYKGFDNGRILSPAGTNIVIDLNSYKIDRNLAGTESGVENGHVMLIQGNLTIEDNSTAKTGKITGGYNKVAGSPAVYGGGVYVAGGTFSLRGGSIDGNKESGSAVMGIGVLIKGGTFNMYGGSVANHSNVAVKNSYGAGVCVYSSGTFNMYGGVIENNTAVFGGGVAAYGVSTGTDKKAEDYVVENGVTVKKEVTVKNVAVYIDGGIIRNNTTDASVSSATNNGGGGICLYNQSTAIIKSGEIYNNRADYYGGGIYCATATQSISTLYVNGGSIHNNVVTSLTRNGNGGGIALVRTSATKTMTEGVFVNAIMTGGSIDHNAVITCCETATQPSAPSKASFQGIGGGVYILRADMKMYDGEIVNNRVCSYKNASSNAETLKKVYEAFMKSDITGIEDDICDGYRTFGGGVGIQYWGLSDGYLLPAGSFEMGGGSMHDNRADSGGGLYNDGEFTMSGGSITDNCGLWGGGMYIATYGRVKFFGKIVIADNYNIIESEDGQTVPSNVQVAAADDRRPQIVGKLEDGSKIRVSVNDSLIQNGNPLTIGYKNDNRTFISVDGKDPDNAENPTNGVWVYANPYRYFASDKAFYADKSQVDTTKVSEQHLMVLEDGELGIGRKPIMFIVTYSDFSTKNFIFGDETIEDMPEWNYVSCTYNDKVFPKTIAAYVDGKQVGEAVSVDNEAGVYTIKANPNTGDMGGKTEAVFYVVVKAKTLATETDGLKVELSDDHFVADRSEKIPTSCVVTFNDITLVAGTKEDGQGDYWLEYLNNVNAGWATVVVHFRNNYAGEARTTYRIYTYDDPSITTKITWEVLVNGEWVPFTSSMYGDTFTYIFNHTDLDGVDQSGKIRAKLTVETFEFVQTVYAYGIDVSKDDELQNTSMYISFQGDENIRFRNAGTYTIKVEGDGNYNIIDNDRTISGVEMNKLELTLSADDFEDYVEDDGAITSRLWQLQIGSGDSAIYTNLLDKTTYVDPQATANKFGEKVTIGTENDAYARYRAVGMSLVLDNGYPVSGKTVSYWLEMALSVTYTPAEGVVGVFGDITTVTTTVTITFNGNYSVGNDNTIVLTKIWNIVTSANNLRMANGNSLATTELEGWTFGNPYELQAFTFRPEHSDTVIYTYYSENNELVTRFALVYSNETSDAYRQFYAVKEEDGKIVVDKENPYDSENFMYNYNYTLKAGTYRIEISIPLSTANVEMHTHWWDNNSLANDFGARYYEFSYEFTFTVAQFSVLEEGSTEENVEFTLTESKVIEYKGLRIMFPDNNNVVYDGTSNNLVKPIIMLYNTTLEENVEYTLSTESVNAGSAVLTITGINSLKGNIIINEAFNIVQAVNGWYDIPSIANWTYDAFDRQISLINGLPNFGVNGMWFAVFSDREGTKVIEGLEEIVLDEYGYVNASVAKILNGLDAGYYYLFAYVEATNNYSGLENSVQFRVFTATNSWVVTPTVNTWIEGRYDKPQYDEDGNLLDRIVVNPVFGTAHVHIEDDRGKVFYDSDEGIDILNDAKPGRYFLTAWVFADKADLEGVDPVTVNFSGLDKYTLIFYVFEAPGLPWWGTLLIAVGSLLLAALIIFILWKKGVFRIVTDKILLKIRTRVSVESTIASVRAAKRMEEGRKSVAEAKRRERLEQLRQKAQEQRAMSPEERAAQLEAKTQAAEAKMQAEAARLEKLRARSEKARAQAEKSKDATPQSEEKASEKTDTPENADAPETPDTPTEE